MVKRALIALLVCAVLFVLVLPALAQDTTPPVIPPDVIPVADAGAALIALVLNFLAPFGSSPLTTALTSLLKMVVPESLLSGPALRNIVAAVLTVGYWLAVHYNFQDAFASIGGFLVTVLPAAFMLYKNFVGSSDIYKQAVDAKTPVLSYKRT